MQTHTPLTLDSLPVLAWVAPTRPTVERSRQWYLTAGAIVFLAAAYGIMTGSWSFTIVCVLAGGMYALIHDHQPPLASIELHDSGIRFNGSFIRWDELAGFWFLQTKDATELRLVPRRRTERLVIQMGDHTVSELRMILGQRLPELTNLHENIVDLLIRICKL